MKYSELEIKNWIWKNPELTNKEIRTKVLDALDMISAMPMLFGKTSDETFEDVVLFWENNYGTIRIKYFTTKNLEIEFSNDNFDVICF